MAQTDDDIRQRESGFVYDIAEGVPVRRATRATSFRIHVALPLHNYPGLPESAKEECEGHARALLAEAGCSSYSITRVAGCWDDYPEPGLVIERIYPEARPMPARGFRSVAEQLRKDWGQEEVWITRTELSLEVLR